MKFSIITVSYNAEHCIAHCIDSVLCQSHHDVDYIAIDGASSDDTFNIISSYGDKIFYKLSEPDLGIYNAMNKGIGYARGDIVGFLNADDFYTHDRVLEKVSQCFADDPALDACYSDLMYVDQLDTSRNVRYWESDTFVSGSFSFGWCPPHPTFFVRRSVYERFGGFNLGYTIAADFELMMRFLEVHKLRVKYVSDVWVKMRLGGTTNKNWRNVWIQNQEVLRALKSHGLSVNPLRLFAHKLWSRGLQFVRRPSE
jgi:glycosyltransferase involved in cell wall biosynthesis